MIIQTKVIYIHVMPCWVPAPSHTHTQGEHSVVRTVCQAGQQAGVVAPDPRTPTHTHPHTHRHTQAHTH